MAKMIELDFNPQAPTLRQFGVIALVAFGALGVAAHQEVWLFSGGLGAARLPVTSCLIGLGAVSGVLSAVYPQGNRALFVGLSILAYPIGFVLSYLLLGVLFFGVFAPIGTVLRLLGKDPMQRRFDRGRQSYWSEARAGRDKASYFRQF